MREFSSICASCEPSLGGCMRRSVGLGLLMTLACPLVVAGQGVPAADSLAKAASAASAANTVAINFVWTLVAGFLVMLDRKSTRLNSSHGYISYAVFCLKKKKKSR